MIIEQYLNLFYNIYYMTNKQRHVSSLRQIAPFCNRLDCGVIEEIRPDNNRVIRFHNRPDQFEQHKYLISHDINTLDLDEPVLLDYNDFSLLVPRGTIPLQDQLKSIARKVDEYSEIFFTIGLFFKKLYKNCAVLPLITKDRSLLESIIMVPSDSESNGMAIVLTPPYLLTKEKQLAVEAVIKKELIESGFFNDNEIITLMQAYQWGYEIDD